MTLRAPAVRVTGDPWMFHMRRGEFAAAWEICDDVLRSRRGKPCFHLPRHLQYLWDGTPLDGKRVLVRCYHGLGDTVQFVRFAPLIQSVALEVIVWAQPALLPILRSVRGIDRLIPLHDGTPDIHYDIDVESMELAHVFRITPDSLSAYVPYLHVAPAPPLTLPPKIHGSPGNIGLVWSCASADDPRSVPLNTITPLLSIPNLTLHILQRGPARKAWPPGIGVDASSDDIEETARRMLALDLLISVDSFPTHLAGALGVPVWTLLQHQSDWRWMAAGDTSPWYPTMRLFRQPRPGDWASVIGSVCENLSSGNQTARS